MSPTHASDPSLARVFVLYKLAIKRKYSCNDTMLTYDPNGRLESVTDPERGTVTFGYDLAGQRTSLTDPNGAQRTWVHDDGGRQTTAIDAENRTTKTSWGRVSTANK